MSSITSLQEQCLLENSFQFVREVRSAAQLVKQAAQMRRTVPGIDHSGDEVEGPHPAQDSPKDSEVEIPGYGVSVGRVTCCSDNDVGITFEHGVLQTQSNGVDEHSRSRKQRCPGWPHQINCTLGDSGNQKRQKWQIEAMPRRRKLKIARG